MTEKKLPLKVELRKILISEGVIVGTLSKFFSYICNSDGVNFETMSTFSSEVWISDGIISVTFSKFSSSICELVLDESNGDTVWKFSEGNISVEFPSSIDAVNYGPVTAFSPIYCIFNNLVFRTSSLFLLIICRLISWLFGIIKNKKKINFPR